MSRVGLSIIITKWPALFAAIFVSCIALYRRRTGWAHANGKKRASIGSAGIARSNSALPSRHMIGAVEWKD